MPLSHPTARPSRLAGLVATALLALLLASSPTTLSAAGAAAERSRAAADVAFDVSPPSPDGAGSWQWPVVGGNRIVRPFVAPATKYSAGHRGIDIEALPSGEVVSPADGIVHFAGVVVDRPVVSIRHPDGVISSFEPVLSTLAEGTAVARGSPIGIAGAGHCDASCIHVGVRVYGEYVSPLVYLGSVPRAVLLPTRR